MDGGVMRGSDIIKALALGAKAVLVGRAPLWGVAVAGQAGAALALEILAEESLRVLGQLGCARVNELGPDVLWTGHPLQAPAVPLAPPRAIASVASRTMPNCFVSYGVPK